MDSFHFSSDYLGELTWVPSEELQRNIEASQPPGGGTQAALQEWFSIVSRSFLEGVSAVCLVRDGELCVFFSDSLEDALKRSNRTVTFILQQIAGDDV